MENIFRDSKLGAALRHLPSGYPQVNLAWMWGALLAATMAAWLHQLTAVTVGEDIIYGHGVRGGKAMIATLRWRLIAVPGGSSATPATWCCGCRPGTACFPRSWPGYGNCQPPPDLRTLSCGSPSWHTAHQPRTAERHPDRDPGARSRAMNMPSTRKPGTPRSFTEAGATHHAIRGIGSEHECQVARAAAAKSAETNRSASAMRHTGMLSLVPSGRSKRLPSVSIRAQRPTAR